jgi:hypothetical protein
MCSNDQHRVFGVILGSALSVASILMAVYIFVFVNFYKLRELPKQREPFLLFAWGIAVVLAIAGMVAIISTYRICENTSVFGFTLILFYILISTMAFTPIVILMFIV